MINHIEYSNKDKAFLSVFFFTLAVCADIFFIHTAESPKYIGYILILVLFSLPIAHSIVGRTRFLVHLLYLLVIPGFLFLLVSDPVEYGLFGHDPYMFTIPAHHYMGSSPQLLEFIGRTDSWPGLYYLTVLIQRLTNAKIVVIGKYLPFVAAVTPALLYVALRRLITVQSAFLVCLAYTSTRTLHLFESKFIEEPLALALFFTAIVSISLSNHLKQQKVPRFSIVIIITIVTLSLTHHALSLIATVFVFLCHISIKARGFSHIPTRFRPKNREYHPSINIGIVSALVLTILLVYAASDIVYDVGLSILISASKGSGTNVGGPTPGQTFRGTISSAVILVFVINACIVAYGFLSETRLEAWLTSWIAFSGLVSTVYAVSLVMGQFFSLDPIRFLIVMVPTLLTSSTAIIIKKFNTKRGFKKRRIIISGIMLLFIITQVMAVDPYILYSDPNQTTLREGHYTPEQFTASEWASDSTRTIIAYERGLWLSKGNTNVKLNTNNFTECDGLRVWRSEDANQPPTYSIKVYHSGSVSLSSCSVNEKKIRGLNKSRIIQN